MQNEKLPKDYDQSVVQKVIESIKNSMGLASKKASQDLADTAQEIKDSISKLARKVSALAGEGEGEQGKAATYLPPPENLTAFEFGPWGFAHLDPFFRWKYRGKIVGYEFYGSMNVDDQGDFEIHETDYVQKGIHYAYDSLLEGNGTTIPNTYLHTEGPTGPESHILDRRLVKPVAANRLILENVTQGTSKIIGGDGVLPVLAYHPTNPKYKIRAGNLLDSLEWYDGDEWRIKDYPNNLLFSIGALSVFYKRAGNFYVKARSIGKGHSYSNFTDVVTSEGLTSTDDENKLPAPTIVMPVHLCSSSPYVTRICSIDPTTFKPVCPTDGEVQWDTIIAGTRETDHFSFFGFEACNVELVWEEIEGIDAEVTYQSKRKAVGPDLSDEEDEEREEG